MTVSMTRARIRVQIRVRVRTSATTGRDRNRVNTAQNIAAPMIATCRMAKAVVMGRMATAAKIVLATIRTRRVLMHRARIRALQAGSSPVSAMPMRRRNPMATSRMRAKAGRTKVRQAMGLRRVGATTSRVHKNRAAASKARALALQSRADRASPRAGAKAQRICINAN